MAMVCYSRGISGMSDSIKCTSGNKVYNVGGYENWGTCTWCGSNNDQRTGAELVSHTEFDKQDIPSFMKEML